MTKKDKIDLLIVNASELLTVEGSHAPKVKGEMMDLGVINDGAIAIKGEKIHAVGKTDALITEFGGKAENVLSAEGKTVMPGFIDCHNHLVFAGSREYELEMKIKGMTYLEITEKGGGIHRTVRDTRKASLEQLVEEGRKRLDQMMKFGTTYTEAKSGYGLNLDDEVKILKAIQQLNETHVVDLVPTFLGAHALSPEFKDHEAYTKELVEKIIPAISKMKVAEFCDVFCELGFFNVDQSRRILKKGLASGLRPKIHADEITEMGGAELAAELAAISAEHLNYPSARGLKMMAEQGVIGVLLPGSAYSMIISDYADARRVIDAGVPVALATDLTPNSWTESMQFVISLACYNMNMMPSEAVAASTINAAHAINRAEHVGSLEKDKLADIIILDVPNHKHIAYHYGVNLVEKVIKRGKIVV